MIIFSQKCFSHTDIFVIQNFNLRRQPLPLPLKNDDKLVPFDPNESDASMDLGLRSLSSPQTGGKVSEGAEVDGAAATGAGGPTPTPWDVVQMARYLGIDPVTDCEYLWIAEEALVAQLPGCFLFLGFVSYILAQMDGRSIKMGTPRIFSTQRPSKVNGNTRLTLTTDSCSTVSKS